MENKSTLSDEELLELLTLTITVDESGNKFWRNTAGRLHRTIGPAVEYSNGDKEYWINGKRHRIDGPAVDFVNGHKEWWVNDQLHREGGPAVIYRGGVREEYFVKGNRHCRLQPSSALAESVDF